MKTPSVFRGCQDQTTASDCDSSTVSKPYSLKLFPIRLAYHRQKGKYQPQKPCFARRLSVSVQVQDRSDVIGSLAFVALPGFGLEGTVRGRLSCRGRFRHGKVEFCDVRANQNLVPAK